MTDKPISDDERDDELNNDPETLIVPPPNFQERLEAAQRARANEAHGAVEIPNPLTKSTPPPHTEEPSRKDE
ncbi:MAG: hypothetical protein IT324_22185 [Anaerolineae bacterium]|nr:hypothetical protein [Anaerolineae bacterium]